MYDVSEDIELAVEHYARNMPERIKRLIDLANTDLYCGPVYLDANGDECGCFDEGAKQFNFKAAIREIGEYLDDVEDIRVELIGEDEDGDEVKWSERIDGSAQDIIRSLVGRELAGYV